MGDLLKDKVAIVTGAGRGIGRGVAKALAREGAKVVVNDPGVTVSGEGFDQRPADEVVEEIRKEGGTAVANYDSVATMQGGENIVRTALDAFGRLDIVVTCHGILRDRMVFNMTEEEWDAVINVHLKGTFTVVKHASVLFRQQRSGRIITFSSESGLVGNAGQANYGAAKSGIAGFTKVVARDLGRYGVTANAIAPRALTRMTENLRQIYEQLQKQRGVQTGIEATMDMFYDPEDVAPFVCFLASDYASHINGQVFLVYGPVIALMSQPRLVRSIFKPDGIWTVEELREVLPRTLFRGVENPAPPQAPRQ